MNISLPAEQARYVREKVQAGIYPCESDVIRDALRLMADHDTLQGRKLAALRHEINKGLDSLDGGEGKPLDIEAIKAKGRALLEPVRVLATRGQQTRRKKR